MNLDKINMYGCVLLNNSNSTLFIGCSEMLLLDENALVSKNFVSF